MKTYIDERGWQYAVRPGLGNNMNELIKIETNENGDARVSGRELHAFLEVKTPYIKWFPRMVEYAFTEGEDFWTNLSESTGGRPATDHMMTIDMAKEICMVQRTERAAGRERHPAVAAGHEDLLRFADDGHGLARRRA